MTKPKSRRDKVIAGLTRDTILFVTGLAGIAYETLTQGADRPTLLVLFGAMIGLPAFLRSDEARKSSDDEDEDAA